MRAAATAVPYVDDAVATLAEGYAVARRDLIRREESLRRNWSTTRCAATRSGHWWNGPSRSGLTSPGSIRWRWPRRAGRPTPTRRSAHWRRSSSTGSAIETYCRDQRWPARGAGASRRGGARADFARAAGENNSDGSCTATSRRPRGRPWRVAVGRAHPGLYGIARSYEESREALNMAGRLHVNSPVVSAHDLLVYGSCCATRPSSTWCTPRSAR